MLFFTLWSRQQALASCESSSEPVMLLWRLNFILTEAEGKETEQDQSGPAFLAREASYQHGSSLGLAGHRS